MENQPELLVVGIIFAWISGVFFGAGLTVFLQWVQRRKEGNGHERDRAAAAALGAPLADDDDDDKGRLAAIERAQKMLLGRLNRLAPPRAGTGAGDGEETRQDAPGPKISESPESSIVPLSRNQVLAAWRARRGR